MGIKKAIYLTVAILGAVAMSQFPEFQQQYKQRMGGTLDELNRQVLALDGRAADAGLDRYDYIRRFLESPDAAVKSEGEHLSDMLGRQLRVRQAIDEMDNAKEVMLLITVLFHLDLPTAQATFDNYKPAIPITISGGFHALAGFVIGYLLVGLLFSLLPRRGPRTSWSNG